MKFTKPVSPGHSLGMLNDKMQTDILRSLHSKIEPRLKDRKASRLTVLIVSLKETIHIFEDFPELVLSPNPFCTNPIYPFDKDKAHKDDMELMKFHLSELKKISNEVSFP